MAFPNNEIYLYRQPSDTQSLVVRSAIIPAIEIVSKPDLITNSLQASFLLRVVDRDFGDELYLANLSYKLAAEDDYISMGTDRELDLLFAPGRHEIFFNAELNGHLADTLAQASWTIDIISPIIASITPINGSNQINTLPAITIEFSENMKIAETISALTISPSTDGTWMASGNLFSYLLTNDLEFNTEYVITVGAEAKDLANNNIASSQMFTFTTLMEPINRLPSPPNFDDLYVPTKISNDFPRFAFNVPNDLDNDGLHFVVEIATDETFSASFLTYNTINHSEMFSYYGNAEKVNPFPSPGVPANLGQVVFTTPVPLVNGQYWFRFFSNDRR